VLASSSVSRDFRPFPRPFTAIVVGSVTGSSLSFDHRPAEAMRFAAD
jgi:hypothetical protein